MADLRPLVGRMADELDHYRQLLTDDRREIHALAAEARAVLAEPQPPADGEVVATGKPALQVEPSDEELLELMPQQLRDDLATVSALAAHGAGPDIGAGLFRVSLNTGALDFARAVLARWGDATPQPIPVAERLPEPGDCDAEGLCWVWNFTSYTWGLFRLDLSAHSHWLPAHALPLPAGEQHHPTPVPVSERLPGDQLCWWYEPDEDDDGSGYGGRWTLLRIRGGTATYTHWLPAHSLPVPAEEGE